MRDHFRGDARFIIMTMEHPNIPIRVIELRLEWIQPIPTHHAPKIPAPAVIASYEEEDDLEEGEPIVHNLEQEAEDRAVVQRESGSWTLELDPHQLGDSLDKQTPTPPSSFSSDYAIVPDVHMSSPLRLVTPTSSIGPSSGDETPNDAYYRGTLSDDY